MTPKSKKLLENPKFILLLGLTSIAVFFVVLNIIDRFYYRQTEYTAKAEVAKFYQNINNDLDYLSDSAQEIVQSRVLNQAIKENDTETVRLIIEDLKDKYQISGFLTINNEGVTLTRSRFSSQYGDYILPNYGWGSLLMTGKPINTIEQSTNYPLMMKAIYPIMERGQFIGAIILAKLLDDDYASNLKNILGKKSEIIFYSHELGIISSSLNLEESQTPYNSAKYFLANYYNSHSNIENSLAEEETQHLSIDNTDYAVRNLAFYNTEDKIAGGVLILVRQSHKLLSVIASLLITILGYWLMAAYLRNRYKIWKKIKISKGKKTAVVASGLCVFVLFYAIANEVMDYKYSKLQKPQFLLYNSVLKIDPTSSILDQNFQHVFSILVEPGGEAINAVGAVIKYDPQMLKIIEIDKSQSICRPDLFLESRFDKTKGEIYISCILPETTLPIKQGLIANVVAQPIKTGSFYLSFDQNQSQVLANDGLGTNVLRTSIGGGYQVKNFKNPAEQSTLIFSPTHPNSNFWYQNHSIELSWIKENPDTKYIYSLNNLLDSLPDENNIISENHLHLNINQNGIYYFHLQSLDSTEAPVSNFRIMIDNDPPQLTEKAMSSYSINAGEVVRFNFAATDDLSGVQSYYIKINNGIFLPVASPLYIPLTDVGMQNITLRVYDNANNFVDDTIQVKVNGKSILEKIINIDLGRLFRH